MQGEKIVAFSDNPKAGKRVALLYVISIDSAYLAELLVGFRGEAAAQFFRQYTSDLHREPFSSWPAGTYGAWRKLLAMFAQDKDALRDCQLETTARGLKSNGIRPEHLKKIAGTLSAMTFSVRPWSDFGKLDQ